MEPTLDWLVGYEVRASKRYGRFLSMVLAAPHGTENGVVQKMLRKHMRTCDAVLQVNGYTAIIMSETDKEGAVEALERCCAAPLRKQVAFGLATFPVDTQLPDELIGCARRRLERARDGGTEFIVTD